MDSGWAFNEAPGRIMRDLTEDDFLAKPFDRGDQLLNTCYKLSY
jgi:hypothetical protein